MTKDNLYGVNSDGSLRYTTDDQGNKIYYYNTGNRLFFLESSIAASVNDLKSIASEYPLGAVYAGLETFAATVQSRLDYQKIGGYTNNMAAANVQYLANYTTLFNALKNLTGADGTRQDLALSDNTFFNTNGQYIRSAEVRNTEKYVILVTDGAPNGTDVNTVIQKAEALKSAGINVITIGLGIENVTGADRMLYWSASAMDSEGKIVTHPTNPSNLNSTPSATADKRLFYWAESGDDLTWIMREIVRTVMKEATVTATVRDEINPAFYPVDKNGVPLSNNDWIKLDGTKWTTSDGLANRAGKITYANGTYAVEWEDQDASWGGWTGNVYVKAKEDFLGGNNVATNDYCSIVPERYATNKGVPGKEKSAPFTLAQQEAKKAEPRTPLVNVDELHMTSNQTDFTVYLGKEVNPGTELTKLWNEIKVIEVVDEGGDSGAYTITSAGDMYYGTDSENKATKDEIYPQSGYEAINLSHYIPDSVLTGLLTQLKTSNSVSSDPIDYAPFGQGKVGELVVTLTKNSGGNPDPHATDTVSFNSPTEQYTIRIAYTPSSVDDRKTVLVTAGRVLSDDTDYKHNGKPGPGNETDESTSQSIHRVYVFAKGLQITKKDESFLTTLPGAEFKLYRSARTTDAEGVKEQLAGLTGKYVAVETLSLGSEGMAMTDYIPALQSGEAYYLVETKAPDGYNLLDTPIPVEITVTNHYTPKPNGTPQLEEPASGLYDLAQSATLTLTSSSAHLATASGEDINGSGVESDSESDLVYYLISNNPGVELPATGGAGTVGLYAVGALLILGGGAMLLAKQRMAA